MMPSILELFDRQRELLNEKQTIFSELLEIEKMANEIRNRQGKVEDELSKLRMELERISEVVEPTMTNNDPIEEYNTEWPNAIKSKFLLNRVKKCSTVRNIIDELMIVEPDLNTDENQRVLMNSLSGLLSKKAKKSLMFKRYHPFEGSEWYYGLKEWFVDGEEPLDEYKPF